MRNIMILSTSLLLIIFSGCASAPIFESNGSQTLKSESEFGRLTAQPDVYQGRAVKLAGRIVGVESTAEGTIVSAEWLPYPQVEYEGPRDMERVRGEKFTVFYPGKLDTEGRLHGNKFLVVGKVGDPKVKNSRRAPYVMAKCLHVWKTGDDAMETQIDIEYSVAMEETYCSNT